jgi:hypothetical protein
VIGSLVRERGGRRLAGILLGAALIVACATNATKDFDNDDPLRDSFFDDSIGGSSLDEVWQQPAPSVGWLANEDLYDPDRAGPSDSEEDVVRRERRAAGAGEVVEAERRTDLRDRGEPEDDEDGASRPSSSRKREKTFSEKAQEATMATMSVLIGAGMTALPYLLGT